MSKINHLQKFNNSNAVVTGVFYLLAAITSIIALILYQPLLNSENYLQLEDGVKNQILLGAFFELLTVITVIGTSLMLFPYLRKYNESFSLGYLCFRFMEATLIIIGTLCLLSLVSLPIDLANNSENDYAVYQASGLILKEIHKWTFILGPNYMLGLNTFIYSFIFYKTNLVPKNLASLGLVASISIFLAAILELFGVIQQISISGAMLAIPVFLYEMTLAIWLIIRGFNLQNLQK